MAPRKDVLTPAERLARLAGAARPASEQSKGPEEDHRLVSAAPEVGEESGETPAVGEGLETHVTPHVTSDVTPHVTSDVTPHVTSDVTPHVTSDVTPHVTSDVTPHVTSDVTPHTEKQASREGDGFDVRVRGRWTTEQHAYIKDLAKQHNATAGEIIRFAIAWYLANHVLAPAARQVLAPSADVLVKRETGLKLLDFLTTADQASAIKTSAGAAGEAAWMRRAVDEFRRSGPFSNKVS